VIEALTEEDMERLRIRRSSKTQAGGGADGKSANAGMPQPHELGLGMVAKEVKDDVLPLRSDLYDYCLEYFKEPQMKVSGEEITIRHSDNPKHRPYRSDTRRR
jgi:regulator-associated protein of mTOR